MGTVYKNNSKKLRIGTIKPEELPSIAEIRNSIPKHCFEYSVIHSLYLVFRDGVIIAGLTYIMWNFLAFENLTWFDTLLWNIFWFLLGTALTGWWVVAHECGHRGFSDNIYFCDSIGWVLHSLLLVPYFSWQYSHGKHHAKTNHLLDGETHNPPGRKYFNMNKTFHKLIGDDAFAIFELITHLVFGWPMYLFFNATGARRTTDKERITTIHDHFRTSSKIFQSNRGWDTRVFASTVGCLLTLASLYLLGDKYGHGKISRMYWPSYLWVNFWLVLYTWLQHTSKELPHFGESEWTWVRGALCTIDRPYGVFDWMHHHIGSTHVVHHLFHTLPCYHAVEATAAIKKFLEPKGLYHYDPTPFPIAAWKVTHECHYMEDVTGVQYFKSMNEPPSKKKN
jgi:omega-6 fatty acid desaturase (delta-12 desaturase)